MVEVDSEALPDLADNPYGLDLVTRATPVRSEAEAARDYNWADASATWKVVNPDRTNRHGATRPTSSCPAARSRRCWTRASAVIRAHRSSGTRCG